MSFPVAPWLLLAAASAVFLGLYDVCKKSALEENAVLPVLFATNLVAAALVVPLLGLSWMWPGVAHGAGVFVHPLGAAAHGLVAVKAAIVSCSWVLTFFALKELPISLAAPIRASAPLFTLLGAVLVFRERPSAAQWAGIACMLAAYYAFSVLGRAEGIHFRRNRWVGLLVLGTLLGALSALYDKHLLASAALPPLAVQVWFTLYAAAVQGLWLLVLWAPRRERTARFEWRLSIPAVAILLLCADQLYFRALASEGALVSVVSAVRRSNVVVSFAVGSALFSERNRRPKALALAGVLAGLLLLVR